MQELKKIIMKEKIFHCLKLAYANLGLSDDILQGQADALAATGLVTDDNLETVVQGQKNFLSSLQSGIDKRVTDAVNKAKEKGGEIANGGEQGKTQPNNEEPEWFRQYKEQQEERFSSLQKENVAFKAEKYRTERNSLISSKAKELGIPEWRMKEGFAISDEMDEAAINTYLSGVKQNIVTAGLEKKDSAFPLSTPAEKSKEMAKQWAEGLPDAN